MKLLLILIFHPTYIVKNRGHVRGPVLFLSIAGYAALCGLAFQHLYPRLLNNVPWLGAFRKFHPGNWNPGFDAELFLRGSAMGVAIILSYALVYFLLGTVKAGPVKSLSLSLTAALATCVPILISCAVGFFFYYLHSTLGLLPVYGLFASVCLEVLLLGDLFGLNRALIVYLVPSLLSFQLYSCFLLLPG